MLKSLLIVVLLSAPVWCEVFTALTTLTKALYHEKDLADSLREYVDIEKLRLQKVLELADEYDRHADEALVDAENYIANPINAYLFVKKFTSDLPHTKELVSAEKSTQDFYDLLQEYSPHLPDEEDLNGVVDAILRLQDTYQLPSHKIADGTFTPTKSSPSMSAQDCFHLGRHAYHRGDWHHMLMWMHQALDVVENEVNITISKPEVLDYLSYAAAMQGNTRHARYWTEEWLRIDPNHERARSNLVYFNKEILSENEELRAAGEPVPDVGYLPPLRNKRITDEYRSGQEFQDYEALCRGEDVMPNKDKHLLKCFYTTSGDHPLLLLAPVKVEEYFLSPYIRLYHDIISDNEIEIVKQISTPMLRRAVVNDPATGQLVTASYRVSRSAWLADRFNETVRTLSNRIHAITHLDMEMTEDLQIQNYGIGGQYEPHCDHAREDQVNETFPEDEGNRIATLILYKRHDTKVFEDWRGNRIATWLVYFTDVDAGGNTVFTQIGAKVPPKKGAAAFWFNLMPDGEGDERTRHAGCPVLSGSKWVANKWFHERGQEFMRPCGLSPDIY